MGTDLQNGLDKFTNFKNDFNSIYDQIISLVDTFESLHKTLYDANYGLFVLISIFALFGIISLIVVLGAKMV